MSRAEIGLSGLRIFVVEDEFAVLLLVEDMLDLFGCKVAASASCVASALEMARTGSFDAAVLDVNLAGDMVYPVAEALSARNIPIVFSTGYSVAGVAETWRNAPILQKPYRPQQLAAALSRAILQTRATGGNADER